VGHERPGISDGDQVVRKGQISMAKTARRGWRTGAVAAMAVAGAVLPWVPAGATGAFAFERIAGENRYASAAELAEDSFPASSGAIVATGESFPDALAASFIAGYVNAPILLVERTRVPEETAATLAELEVKEIVILGGTAAVSEAVETQLKETYEVVRLFGQDRFATAANVALAINPGDIGEIDGKRTAFLTYGYGFADAMAVGPLAFAGRLPILLNGSGGLGTPARVAIERLEIEHVVLVGGSGVLSDAAREEIEALGATTERLQGADRFSTATAVADFAAEHLGFVDDHVNLVRGLDPANPQLGFADALAGSAHAGREQAPLLLTHPTSLSAPTLLWLEQHAATLATGHLIGGASAISADVARAATDAARRVGGEVVDVDLDAATYVYTPDGATEPVEVAYGALDTFTIDGVDATIEAFEDAITVGDRVRVTTAGETVHRLADAD
jgi:putative cell wall-binding protein